MPSTGNEHGGDISDAPIASTTMSDATGAELDEPSHDAPPIPVRWGPVAAITIPLIILNTGWIANSEMKTGVTEVTISSLIVGVTFILFVLTLVNILVRRYLRQSAALNQPELMAVYTMLSMSSVVAGVGHFGFFLPFLANPFDPAASHPDWLHWLYLLPQCIGPRDPSVLRPFFVGHSTFFRPEFMRAWAYPLTFWSAFFLVLIWTTLCLGSILRRRWEEEEHLPFPIIALPLEMTREGAPLYSNRYLWLGFAIPAVLHTLNSLHSVYPMLPTAPINSAHDFVVDAGLGPPWSGMGSFFYMLHASGIGFGFIVSTDVSFSLWFFYLLKKAVDVMAVTMGMCTPTVSWGADANGQFPYYGAQSWGAWIFLSGATLWVARKDIQGLVRRAFKRGVSPADLSEPMSPRLAVFGFVGGFLGMCAFMWSFGCTWWLPIAFLGLYILIMVAIARIRAEAAVLSSEVGWLAPQAIIPTIVGTTNLSHASMAHMGIMSWFNTDYRAPAMPHEMEGLVGQHRTRGRMSPLITGIMVAALVSIIAALLWDLQLYYVNGATSGSVNDWRIVKGSEPWVDVQTWIQNPRQPDANMIGATVFGAALTLLLMLLRLRFVGFPLHPAGYALNMTFANNFFWCDMLVAWLIKTAILRYGGMTAFRNSLPFFYGLILGDFVTGAIWSIVGTLFHLSLFRTFAS
jgi:hypothetical protein